nr:hypothetical protein [Tanacetum cinerariifolium]
MGVVSVWVTVGIRAVGMDGSGIDEVVVGEPSWVVEMSAAGGPAVGMEPLLVGTSIPPARTVAASMEVKTLASSTESSLILSAVASLSFILLPLIGASSPDCLAATLSLSSNTYTLSFNLRISTS